MFDEILKEMGIESQLQSDLLPRTAWKQIRYVLSLADARGFYARLPYDLSVY